MTPAQTEGGGGGGGGWEGGGGGGGGGGDRVSPEWPGLTEGRVLGNLHRKTPSEISRLNPDGFTPREQVLPQGEVLKLRFPARSVSAGLWSWNAAG